MGDYSQTMVAMRLENLTQKEIDIIKVMICEKDKVEDLPNHRFFRTRWEYLFKNSAYYLPVHSMVADFYIEDTGCAQLAVIGGIKWSADEEMEAFIEWIKPKIDKSYSDGYKTFVGFTRFECTEKPTLYYVENDFD